MTIILKLLALALFGAAIGLIGNSFCVPLEIQVPIAMFAGLMLRVI